MAAKSTTVTLYAAGLGTRQFEIAHAERLLRMRNGGGWALKDSNFVFENGTLNRRNKKTDTRESQARND